jgi:hypothetical protein
VAASHQDILACGTVCILARAHTPWRWARSWSVEGHVQTPEHRRLCCCLPDVGVPTIRCFVFLQLRQLYFMKI